MSFWIKKLVAKLMLPVPVSVLLIVLGSVLLGLTYRKKAGGILLFLGVLILIVFGSQPVADRLLHSLEYQYPVHQPHPRAPPPTAVPRFV